MTHVVLMFVLALAATALGLKVVYYLSLEPSKQGPYPQVGQDCNRRRVSMNWKHLRAGERRKLARNLIEGCLYVTPNFAQTQFGSNPDRPDGKWRIGDTGRCTMTLNNRLVKRHFMCWHLTTVDAGSLKLNIQPIVNFPINEPFIIRDPQPDRLVGIDTYTNSSITYLPHHVYEGSTGFVDLTR